MGSFLIGRQDRIRGSADVKALREQIDTLLQEQADLVYDGRRANSVRVLFVRVLAWRSEEVGFIVDDVEQNMKPKRTQTLRAEDVIPPFGRAPGRPDADKGGLAGSEPSALKGGDCDCPGPGDLGGEVGRSDRADRDTTGASSGGGADVPKYDLAENILAEQRRVASRRRRAPTQPREEPPASPEKGGFEPPVPIAPSEDLPELQRIVAEIVAKDIERLCRKPDR